MTFSEETARDQIERFEKSITKSEWKLENQDVSKKGMSRIHSSIGSDFRRIGLYKLLLGETSCAKEKFEKATHHKIEKYQYRQKYEKEEHGQEHWQTQSSTLQEILFTAFLTENDEILETVTKEVETMGPEFKTAYPKTVHSYYQTKSLASVAAESPSQEEYINAFRDTLTDKRPDLRQHLDAIATVLDGIRTHDEETVVDGLNTMLDHHEDERENKPSSLRDHVSRRPLALFLLARKRGLDIDIDNQYIPDTVL